MANTVTVKASDSEKAKPLHASSHAHAAAERIDQLARKAAQLSMQYITAHTMDKEDKALELAAEIVDVLMLIRELAGAQTSGIYGDLLDEVPQVVADVLSKNGKNGKGKS